MKANIQIHLIILLTITSCTSTKKLNYLQNLPVISGSQYFPYELADYKVQYRDILFIDIKALTPDGKIENVITSNNSMSMNYMQGESTQYLLGYNVEKNGEILLPVIGTLVVGGKSLPEIRKIIQNKVDSVLNHSYVEVKLLSFKYTILGEARNPGTYINYNNYLTILEAIGRAGGVSDFGRRDNILVVRSNPEGTTTYRINLQEKNILTSEAYFIMPNDVIIIEPVKHKVFNMNLPTLSFVITTITSAITTTLLLINYFSNK